MTHLQEVAPSRIEYLCMMNACIQYGIMTARQTTNNEPIAIDNCEPFASRARAAMRYFAAKHECELPTGVTFEFDSVAQKINVEWASELELSVYLRQVGFTYD